MQFYEGTGTNLVTIYVIGATIHKNVSFLNVQSQNRLLSSRVWFLSIGKYIFQALYKLSLYLLSLNEHSFVLSTVCIC